MADELNLTITLHRPAYQNLPTPQQAYVLLEAMPTAAAPGTGSQMVNFSLVLDRSGSMDGERLRQLKEAAKLVVDRLGPQDILSVIAFDNTADVVVPAGPVQDRVRLKSQIDSIGARGGTTLSTGMQAGLQQLQAGLAPGRVSRMLLLTDGQTWEDKPQCEQLAAQCQAAGVSLSAFGLGMASQAGWDTWDPQFLEALAQHSGGEWMPIETPDKVSAAFTNTLQEMQGTAVTNASLTMRFVEGLTARTVWRVTPMISRLGHQAVSARDLQVFLGDIQHGTGQHLLADLLLPVRQPGAYRLIQADIVYDVPGTGLTRQRANAEVIVTYTPDPVQANQTNPRLMNIVERVVAHKLQTQALDEAAAGDVPRATRRLRAAATRLLDMGEENMAQQAMQQAAQLEQAGQVDPAAAQRMRYQTKKLNQPEQP